ncbi:hypothetical protein ACRALDRAFT_1058903 [Sodiomyces alcalophilus JCM 7366]|uniref:uncharacterized protein n=1 Tax=Sodiomyces alcalophilus JCM 7366 TaxID=591952 RepID=UPI0039B605DE
MDHTDANPEEASGSFGQSYILQPQSEHTHTAIVLHGRGSCGEEFAEDFLASTLSDGRNLRDKMPGWRWVFPSSRELWSSAFRQRMPAWFEAHSLTDPTARQNLQVDGLRESVGYVLEIMEEESKRLGGNPQRLVLGGISQGGAVGMWALLCQRDATMGLGGFFAASTWLPFAADVEDFLVQKTWPTKGPENTEPKDATPVFMGHGTDDAYVDVELGRQAAHILAQGGWKVEWNEYVGAEEEGHWFKVPDEMDAICEFLVQGASNE